MRVLSALSLSSVLWAGSAFAQTAEYESDGIDWRWRRFQAWEYVATGLALGTGFYLRFGASHPDPDWKGGILFDDWVRDRTSIGNRGTRDTVDLTTDVLFFGSMGYRFVDSVIVPGVIWGNADTALQMSLIDLEAFGLVAITLWGSQAAFGRQRPWVDKCEDPEERESYDCESDPAEENRSFYAGHPAVGMTAAGLTCVHHAHLPLYGGGAADTLACGVMVGAAVANGAGRVLSEKHYATDLAIGFGIGIFAGWGLPQLLHYDHPRYRLPRTAEKRNSPLAVRATVVPMISDDRLGMSLYGLF